MTELASLRRDYLPDAVWFDDPIRVVLCDDHAMFRRGLTVVLEDEGDLEIVGEADNGPEAAALAEALAPDLLFVDINLPPYGGVAACSQIVRAVPTARVVLLAANEKHPDELLEGVGAGALGIILKEQALDDAADIARRVDAGECILSPTVARALRDLVTGEADVPAPGVAPLVLDPRERLVVEVVARGADAADAATGLGIERHTAINLLRNAVRRIQRTWRAEDTVVSLSTPRQDPDRFEAVARAVQRVVPGG